MKIGFDAKRAFLNGSGLGNYSRSLITGFSRYSPDDKLFLYTTKSGALFNHVPESAKIITPDSFPSWWRLTGIKKDILANDLDIYHGLSNELPVGIEKLNVRSVVSIHDVLYKRYPELYPMIDRKIYDWKVERACKEADKIIAISKQTKNDLKKYYDIDENKITVVYQSCDPSFYEIPLEGDFEPLRNKYHLPTRFILTVGSLTNRKNQKVLIEALALLENDLHLVIVGRGHLKKQLLGTAKDLDLLDKVHILDQVTNQDLPYIYSLSSVFIYPSLFEGFGIPILEAIMRKKPVILGRNSCFPETGGPYSVYIDQESPDQIADAVTELTENSEFHKQVVESSYKFVQKFKLEYVIQNTRKVYESILS